MRERLRFISFSLSISWRRNAARRVTSPVNNFFLGKKRIRVLSKGTDSY